MFVIYHAVITFSCRYMCLYKSGNNSGMYTKQNKQMILCIFLTRWVLPRFENPSVAGPEFRDKRKRGRPKCERRRSKRKRGRYVNEAAQRFGNLCVYETSALRKKPSDSSEITSQFLEEAFRFLEEAFRFAAESPSNAFQKGVPNRGINFKNAYRKNQAALTATPSYHMDTPLLTPQSVYLT